MTDGGADDWLDFDPRRWAAPPPSQAAAPPARDNQQVARRWMLVGAGGLFATAPLVGWLSRDHGGSPVVGLTPTKRAQPSHVAPDVAERSATLADAGQLEAMLIAQGVSPVDAARLAQAALPHLAGGGPITARVAFRLQGDAAPDVLQLKVSRADSSGVVLTRDQRVAGAWTSTPLARALQTRLIASGGEMNDDSLYSSAVAAGVDESLIPDFAAAFVYDFDFQREIHAGDRFEMAAEQTVNASGEPVGAPTLVYASFITATKSRALYRFTPAAEKPGWFDGNGRSVIRSLMRTPVDGARVSSHFGFRTHPVLGFLKMHKGVDFAVPMGTPVVAAGSGTVTAAHFTATGGNMLMLRHDHGYETKYLHLEKFMPGVTEGASVTQGQQVALSGNGGELSTGPHLHYEVHLNGQPIDPLSIQTASGESLTGDTLVAFRRERDRIDAARADHVG